MCIALGCLLLALFIPLVPLLPTLVQYPPERVFWTPFPLTKPFFFSDQPRREAARQRHQEILEQSPPHLEVETWDLNEGNGNNSPSYAGWTITRKKEKKKKTQQGSQLDYRPADHARYTLLFAHGYGSSRQDLVEMAIWLLEEDVCPKCRLLFPDLSSSGESPGAEGHSPGTREADDVLQLLAQKTHEHESVILVGMSNGAAASLLAAYGAPPEYDVLLNRVEGVASFAAYTSASYVLQEFGMELAEDPRWLVQFINKWQLRYKFKPWMERWFAYMSEAGYRGIWNTPIIALHKTHRKIPLLLVHGTHDALVPPMSASLLYTATIFSKQLCFQVMVPRAGHDSRQLYQDKTVKEHFRDLFLH